MIPNYFEDVKAAKTNYPDAWKHAHISGDPRTLEWIKLFAKDLHAKDPRANLNGKRGDPKNLSADAINYLCDKEDSDGRTPDGLPCVVVDVIGGAGGPNPTPGWNVFTTLVEGSGAPVDPTVSGPVPPPVIKIPSYADLGDDAFFRNHIGIPLQADMAQTGQPLNDGSSVWFSRITYSLLVAMIKAGGPVDPAPIVKVHRNEWRAILGLPPV